MPEPLNKNDREIKTTKDARMFFFMTPPKLQNSGRGTPIRAEPTGSSRSAKSRKRSAFPPIPFSNDRRLRRLVHWVWCHSSLGLLQQTLWSGPRVRAYVPNYALCLFWKHPPTSPSHIDHDRHVRQRLLRVLAEGETWNISSSKS